MTKVHTEERSGHKTRTKGRSQSFACCREDVVIQYSGWNTLSLLHHFSGADQVRVASLSSRGDRVTRRVTFAARLAL